MGLFGPRLRHLLDTAVGRQHANLAVAYGAASVLFVPLKYNLIIGEVYRYNGRAGPGAAAEARGFLSQAAHMYRRNIAPGLFWSFVRDSGSVGGGIVLAPVVTAKLVAAVDPAGSDLPHPVVKFSGGLIAGSGCGLATQLFHNAALTAGRMAEAGERPGTLEGMRRVLAEHGARAIYVNVQYRIAVIALWSAVLNVTDPFRR